MWEEGLVLSRGETEVIELQTLYYIIISLEEVKERAFFSGVTS